MRGGRWECGSVGCVGMGEGEGVDMGEGEGECVGEGVGEAAQ